jgi:hypothetical protein
MNACIKRMVHTMPYLRATVFPVLLISFSACHGVAGSDDSRTDAHSATGLEEALDAVNASAAKQHFTIVQLSTAGFMQWYQSVRMFSFLRDERQVLDDNLSLQRLPSGYTFTLKASGPGVYLTGPTGSETLVVEGTDYFTWEYAYLPVLEQTPAAITEEIFLGSPLPSGQSGSFPQSVQLSITEIKLAPTLGALSSPPPDALRIEIVLTPTNLADLIAYFGTAYSKVRVQERLNALLGGAQQAHILLEQVLEGWPGQWANDFPSDKTQADGADANDVCHGVARQFFRDNLDNGGEDRSTEASEQMLRTFYVPQDKSVDPSFGDYLYLPGRHSVRFMLKDPHSGRWVGFSSWSSSFTPYRFWWVDQDYMSPVGEPVPVHADFPSSFDVWRRLQSSTP